MQIIFDTATLTEHEATATMMLLMSLFPNAGKVAIAREEPCRTYTTHTDFVAPSKDVQKIVVIGAGGAAHMGATAGGNGGGTIDPADNPSAGTDTAATVFTQGVAVHLMTEAAGGVSYADHIAQGWTDALLVEHGRMFPATTLADIAVTLAGHPNTAAAIFGGTPAPLAVTNGAQPEPNNTAATPPPPPNDAASVFAAPNATTAPPPPDASAAAVSTPPAPTGMLDRDGLPWDGRIHASTRTCTAKGVWKKKKGVDDATVATVTAELRAVQAANNAAEHKPLNAAPPPPATAVNAAPPPPATGPVTFVEVAKYVGERKFTAEQILTVCKAHGLPGLGLLTGAPNLCTPIMAAFQAM